MLQLPKKEPFFEELPNTSTKLVLILATSVPLTDCGKEVVRMLCIHYQILFQVEDKVNKPRLFMKIFMVANIKFEIILEMLFLKISNVDVSFGEKIFT